MTPKIINWLGGAIVVGILVLVAVGAVREIMIGDDDIRAGVATLAGIAFVIVGTAILKLATRRKR